MATTLPQTAAPTSTADYKVADISLAEWGRKEIDHRRAGNARPDVHPQEVRAGEAAPGRAHHRLAAHDHPDGGAHRDAGRARRRRALGELQHLLHAGPRRRRHRRGRRARLRLEGRDARRILGLHLRRRSRTPAARARSSSSTTAATSRCSSTKATNSKKGDELGRHRVRQPRRAGHQGPAQEGPRRRTRHRWPRRS